MPATVLGDWGTTRLRLWRVADGEVRERREGRGIGGLDRTPAAALGEAMGPWLTGGVKQIVLCGMAGARGGLSEVAYVDCPASRDGWRAGSGALTFEDIGLRIAAGVACRREDGVAEVMRGEETQVFGAIALRPELGRGCHHLILPGTHSKWVRLEEGRIMGFRTFVTGELFGLLRKSSLAATDAPGLPADQGSGFADGLARIRSGASLAGSLFEARAAQLRDGRSAGWALGFLSGLVIAAEIAEMLSRAPATELTIVGDPQLAARYELALAGWGGTIRRGDADACALAGLRLLDVDD